MNRVNFYLLCFLFISLGAVDAALPESEQAALLEIGASLSLSRFGWSLTNASTACDILWIGLACNTNKTAVIQISFLASNLVGTIPDSIGNLTSLRDLTLQQNFGIVGSIPQTIGKLQDLQSLNIGFTSISGTIPPSIGQCTKLESFQAVGARLSGPVPPEIGKTSLRFLNLFGNQLNGTLPHEMSRLSNMSYLTLVANRFTGSIPESFGNLTQLIGLSLSSLPTLDSAPIPLWLGNLKSIQFLELSNMQFTGEIPDIWSQLPVLAFLRLDNNRLTGTIPPSLANSTSIVSLDISNCSLSGTLDFICTQPTLANLNIMSNNFTGTIPECIGRQVNMNALQLSDNRLTGTIPAGLGNLRSLQTFDISMNSFSGPIPSPLSNLNLLSTYYLLQNRLQGCFVPPRGASDGRRCDASFNDDLCACASAEALCNVKLCNCSLPKPLESVYCSSQTRLWTSFDSIVVSSSSTVSIGNQVVINGNLTVSPSSTLQLEPPTGVLQSGAPLVIVSGCATFAGKLQVSLPANFTLQTNTEIQLVEFQGFCNNAPTQFAEAAVAAGCRQITPSLRYNDVSLSVVFMSIDDSQCSSAAASTNVGAIVGGVIAGVIVIIAIIATIVLVKVPSLRKKLIPFKAMRDTVRRTQLADQELE